ncbi:MAG: heat-inducible transcriptional repressor HrcA [Angelakisella sp.]
MELDARKLRILAAITETYLATGEPAGSKLVAAMLGDELSSATVRNEMAALFEMGLLEQPHTSAGRIPSHHGLRIYIDRIMHSQPLSRTERQEIDALFNRRNPDPDRLMEDATKVLAGYTNCAAISTTMYRQSACVRKIELIPATSRTVVILLIASNGMIKNKVCRVDFDLQPRVVEFFTSFANSRLAGRSINEITAAYINSMSFALDEYTELFAPLLTAIYDLCREASDGRVYYSGESNLLEYDELRQVANQLFRVLSSREDMMSIIERDNQDMGVSIGRENQRLELNDSSVLISRYKIGEDSVGAIGLIGPVRMDYAKLIPHLEYFSQMLGKLISDTLDEQK